mgnify:CR=1 FL=1
MAVLEQNSPLHEKLAKHGSIANKHGKEANKPLKGKDSKRKERGDKIRVEIQFSTHSFNKTKPHKIARTG